MHGLKYEKNESQNDLVSKISKCFSEIGLPYEEAEVDSVHRIGKPYNNKISIISYHYQAQIMEIQTRCLLESTKKICKRQKEAR